MKFIVAKNWGDYKKGDEIEILDPTVIDAAKEQGLILEAKKVNKTDKKEE